MPRTRDQLRQISHWAGAFHQIAIEERATRELIREADAQQGDRALDSTFRRLAEQLGYRVEPATADFLQPAKTGEVA